MAAGSFEYCEVDDFVVHALGQLQYVIVRLSGINITELF